jgi:Broad-minded protein
LSNYAVSGFEAQYLKFLHIVFLFKKLALNRSGRQVFPLSISGESFTLDDFSICMLQLIDSEACLSSEIFFLEGFDHSFRISSIVSSFIRDLSNADEYAQALICHPEHLKTLLEPLETALSSLRKGNQNALLAISESLSFIASTVPGRKFLVEVLANQKSALFELVKKVVCTPLPSELLSRKVIGAFIFFLRQIYKTCDGLVVLSTDSLHIALSQQMIKSPKTPEEHEWNTLLVDNILNFGSTPLGLVLLEETGMMLVCVKHMFSKKNLPISQYEPYGYGTLVSQIATTSQGMNALCLSGWIEAVINELWTIIECNEPFGPPELNIDDQRTGKIISNILKLFSTFSGLSACLKHEGEEGGPFTKLIQSLILIDLNFPSGSLGTFEESRQIGLRILKHLISSSLDASILLQVSFGYFESLEQQLKDSYCKILYNY